MGGFQRSWRNVLLRPPPEVNTDSKWLLTFGYFSYSMICEGLQSMHQFPIRHPHLTQICPLPYPLELIQVSKKKITRSQSWRICVLVEQFICPCIQFYHHLHGHVNLCIVFMKEHFSVPMQHFFLIFPIQIV